MINLNKNKLFNNLFSDWIIIKYKRGNKYKNYYDNKIVWFQNNGQGGFGPSQTIKSVNAPKQLILTDVDEDGFIDILTALGINNERVSWYKNDGTGNFGNEITLSISANSVHHLKAEDINGDGHKDIFLHNSNGFPGTVWYENINGTGNFGSKNSIPTNETPKNISLVDFNGNGNLDILYSYNNNYVAWHENLDGLGTFSNRKNIFSLPATAPINSLSAIDISGNGNMDIIIDHSNTTNSNDKIFWFENLGGNNFGPENIIIDNFSQAYIGLNNFNNCNPDCPVGILEFGSINVNILDDTDNTITGQLEIIMDCQWYLFRGGFRSG